MKEMMRRPTHHWGSGQESAWVAFDDLVYLASLIWHIAGDEAEPAQLAVCHALLNRLTMQTEAEGAAVAAGMAMANHARLRMLAQDMFPEAALPSEIRPPPGYRFCKLLADIGCAIDEAVEDPTHGANAAHPHDLMPRWAAGRAPCALIGRRFYYRLPAHALSPTLPPTAFPTPGSSLNV